MNRSSEPVDVAVGVLRDSEGRVLVNRRPAHKVFAGRWEFPGGKMERGETPDRALARELREELGVRLEKQRPLIAFSHDYGAWQVRLHVREVIAYSGSPQGREAQVVHWIEPGNLEKLDLLPANASIVRALRLPRLCLITDLRRFGPERTLDRLARHTGSYRVLLIVREKTLGRAELEAFVSRATRVCEPSRSLLVVHADSDFRAWAEVDGVHLAAAGLQGGEVPRAAGLTGASCHSLEELESASRQDCDYALLSPVRRTESHPHTAPLGWSGFQQQCRLSSLPVFALGGLGFTDLDAAFQHGAQGAAMLSAAWE